MIVDINQDGLEDLLVANLFRYKDVLDKESSWTYYQNTGTASDPVFTFVDDNYLNLTSLGYGLRSVPTFGDLDNDGDKDMLIGIENGTIVYVENQSTGSGSVFTSPVQNYPDNTGQPISAGTFGTPQLFDLDNDGLLDLVIGTKTGEIQYYRNTGTASSPEFTMYNDSLGYVDVSTSNPDGFAAPHFIRHNDTTYLFVGDNEGRANFYTNIDGNLDPTESFTWETSSLAGINTEGYSAFAIADLNNNGNLELYAGQDLGGIYRFEHDENSNVSVDEIEQSNLNIYPNPTNGLLTLSSNDSNIERITLMNVQGQVIISKETSNNKVQIDIANYPSGVYFVNALLSNGQMATKKLIKY